MQVTYKHASGDTVLCHGLDHPGEAGYYTGPLGISDATETEWSVEPIRPIGAADAVPADRGCGLHTFSLLVERRFATELEARAHARNLSGLLPRGGVSLEVTGEETGYKTVYAVAALQKLTTRRNGCSLDILFQFQTSVPVRTAIVP